MAFESSEPKHHSADFGSFQEVRGALLPPVFHQIQFDIYPFLTPGSGEAHGCQFKLATSQTLMGPLDLTNSSSNSVGSLWLCFPLPFIRGRLPSHKPKLWTRALPWDHSHGCGPGFASRKGGLLLWLVLDVNAGGWLPGKVSNTQILLKQNKKQLMQLKLPSLSSWYLNKQFHLHWILSTSGLYTRKYSTLCINFGWSWSHVNQKRGRNVICAKSQVLAQATETLSFLALDAEEFQEDCAQKKSINQIININVLNYFRHFAHCQSYFVHGLLRPWRTWM